LGIAISQTPLTVLPFGLFLRLQRQAAPNAISISPSLLMDFLELVVEACPQTKINRTVQVLKKTCKRTSFQKNKKSRKKQNNAQVPKKTK